MRAIIIEEDRFTDLLSALNETCLAGGIDGTAERCGWNKEMWRAALDEAKRRYHYQFVRWAQSHGASCTKPW